MVPPDDAGEMREVTVRALELFSHDVARMRVETENFIYRPGQFLELIAGDNLRRRYSLACPAE